MKMLKWNRSIKKLKSVNQKDIVTSVTWLRFLRIHWETWMKKLNNSNLIMRIFVRMKKVKSTCDVCDLVVKSKEKLKIHICKITIKNPEHKNLYLKNWIVSKSCTTVFCKEQRKEVAILHSEECLDFVNCCQDLPEWYCKGDEPLGDQHGIYHLRLSNCIRNGEVTWFNYTEYWHTDTQTNYS